MTLLDASSELVPRDVPRRFEGSGAFVGPVMEPWPRPPLHRSPCSKTGKRDGLGKSHTASVVCAWVGNLTSIHGPLCVQIATAMPAGTRGTVRREVAAGKEDEGSAIDRSVGGIAYRLQREA